MVSIMGRKQRLRKERKNLENRNVLYQGRKITFSNTLQSISMWDDNLTESGNTATSKDFLALKLPERLECVAMGCCDVFFEQLENNIVVFVFVDDHEDIQMMPLGRNEICQFFTNNTDPLCQWLWSHFPTLRPQDFVIIYNDLTTADWVGDIFYFDENSLLCARFEVKYY